MTPVLDRLRDDITLSHLGSAHNTANSVGIYDEILTKLLCRADAEPVSQLADVGCPEQCRGAVGHV